MGSIDVTDLSWAVPGRVLFEHLSFRVPSGRHVALVGANGVGKTTVLRLLNGEERPASGAARLDGRIGYMHQFVASRSDPEESVREFLVSLAPNPVGEAHAVLRRREFIVSGPHGHSAQVQYANALARWSEVHGYDYEVLWDVCCQQTLGVPLSTAGDRRLATLSGGEQKRLALEAFFRSGADVLLLDEPDNFLDIPGKQWLEDKIGSSKKTILFVSHDRAVLANTADALVTIEGRSAWTHHGGFTSYARARAERLEKIEEDHRRYAEEHARIVAQIKEFKRRAAMNDKFASRARSAEKKLERFERDSEPRAKVRKQSIRMDLGGGRTGTIALRTKSLTIRDIVSPFDCELYFGERVGVVGANGTGKSHFMKLSRASR